MNFHLGKKEWESGLILIRRLPAAWHSHVHETRASNFLPIYKILLIEQMLLARRAG